MLLLCEAAPAARKQPLASLRLADDLSSNLTANAIEQPPSQPPQAQQQPLG